MHRGTAHWLAVGGDTPAITCQSVALDLHKQNKHADTNRFYIIIAFTVLLEHEINKQTP